MASSALLKPALVLSILQYVWIALATGKSNLGTFTYPEPGSYMTFNYLDTLNVSWTTFADNFTSPLLMLWLTDSLAPFKNTLVFNETVNPTGWRLVPLNYNSSHVVNSFNLQQGDLNSPNATWYMSPFFNITKDDSLPATTYHLSRPISTPTPSSSSTPPSTPTSSSSSTASTAPISDPTADSLVPPQPSSEMSPGIKAAIALATIFGVALLLTLLFLFIRNRRSQTSEIRSQPSSHPPETSRWGMRWPVHKAGDQRQQSYPAPTQLKEKEAWSPSELGGRTVGSELPGTPALPSTPGQEQPKRGGW